MHPTVTVAQATLQAVFVLLPRQAVDAGRGMPLEGMEALPEQVDVDMVRQGGEPRRAVRTT